MAHWRSALPEDDDAIVAMCLALYSHDPAPGQVEEAQIRATLACFRAEPVRGRAVVLEDRAAAVGYALLASFWSNELGGEICTVDEIYVDDAHRSHGHASALIGAVAYDATLWPRRPIALELEVSPANRRAAELYERLGFRARRNTTLRLLLPDGRPPDQA